MKKFIRKPLFILTKSNRKMLQEVYPEILAEIESLRVHNHRLGRRHADTLAECRRAKRNVIYTTHISDHFEQLVIDLEKELKKIEWKYILFMGTTALLLLSTITLLINQFYL